MAQQYSLFIGKRVEVRYRTGYLHMSAVGVLLSDDGATLCLEDHFAQNGKPKTMRVEVPYGCIVLVAEATDEPVLPATGNINRK